MMFKPTKFLFAILGSLFFLSACDMAPAIEPTLSPAEPITQADNPSPLAVTDTPLQLPPTWTATNSPTPRSATETPEPDLDTSTPESIDALETFTPIPADIITPVSVDQNWIGWKWIESKNAKLRVPESFELFDLGQGMGDLMLALLEGLMEGFGETFEGLEDLSEDDLQIEPTEMGFSSDELQGVFDFDFLIAFDDDFITSVVLASEPSNLSLEFAMQQSLQNMEGDFTVLSRQVIEGAEYDMGRFIIEVRDPEMGRDGQQLLYIILHDGQAYSLGYQTLKSKFNTLLPMFEKSASTFTIK
ncbi:MAG: hypothetical protein PVG04_03390 [Anaerolineales bacterium]|jgi:hypothetical protein